MQPVLKSIAAAPCCHEAVRHRVQCFSAPEEVLATLEPLVEALEMRLKRAFAAPP